MPKIIYNDPDILPYKKKKKKKTPAKSDHKHIYKPFIGKYESSFKPGKYNYALMEECEVCKKMNIRRMFLTIPAGPHYSKMVSSEEEIREYFSEYKIKEIEDPLK